MAEVAPANAPDDARRWRVDAAPPGADSAPAMVTLPAYALSTGDYILTLWEGDASAAWPADSCSARARSECRKTPYSARSDSAGLIRPARRAGR